MSDARLATGVPAGVDVRVADDDDRGATTSVGMIVALSALGMTFAALLLAYAIVRAQAPVWPPPGETPLPPLWTWRLLATAASIAGSVAMAAAARRAHAGRDARGPLAAAAGSGIAFLAAQAVALVVLGRSGVGPGAGLAASVVYALCSFHALHVVAALLALVSVLPSLRAAAGVGRQVARSHRVDAVAAFWHLVTAVWCVLFLGVFVL